MFLGFFLFQISLTKSGRAYTFSQICFNVSGLTCKVSAGNDVACLTTDLLAALGKLEPVLVPLVLAFRYWARVSF